MSDNPLQQHIGGHEVPKSATTALEFLLWVLERSGWKFRHGKTALYWHLIHVIMSHRKDEA